MSSAGFRRPIGGMEPSASIVAVMPLLVTVMARTFARIVRIVSPFQENDSRG